MSRLLVTTADSRLWKKNKPLLLLGAWCFRAGCKSENTDRNIKVIPYHWDDREKLLSDYDYLQRCYEDALSKLVITLNDFHDTNHSLRYWRILIGPWLYLFIHILYDRWYMILKASEEKDISTIIINEFELDVIPRDLRGMSPDGLRWNNFLYSCAIKEQNKIKWVEVTGNQKGLMQNSSTVESSVGLKSKVFNSLRSFLNRLVFPQEAFFITTHLPRRIEMKLQLMLGQFPKFWCSPKTPFAEPDIQLRNTLKLYECHSKDDFQCFLAKMLPRQIPTVYLEGYPLLQETVKKLPWPSKPKFIFTSNSFQFDEVFQCWSAEKVEKKTPLIIAQHGGYYGIGQIAAGEEHQVKIADRFLTWGWKDERKSVFPSIAITNLEYKDKVWKHDGELLIVTVPIRRVSFKCSSWPIAANQSQEFLSEQLCFAKELEKRIMKRLILRIHKKSDDKLQSAFIPQWLQAFPEVRIDPSDIPIERQIKRSRLFVYTYNSTGFLETLGRNIPTVIFWNPEFFELRKSAEPYFEKLKDAGIFHECPLTAAQHINEIWDDVSKWWNSSRVQFIRKEFCEIYSNRSENPMLELQKAIKF